MRAGPLEVPVRLAPARFANPDRHLLSQTLRTIFLTMIAGSLAVSTHTDALVDRMGLWALAAVLFGALALNHFGKPEWAANLGLLAMLVFTAAMAWVARDGFRSINFYLLIGLLMLGAVLLRPAAYTAFALLAMTVVAVVGMKEMRMTAQGVVMHRSATTYSLIFDVECIFSTTAVAGGLLVRNMQRKLREVGEASAALADANGALRASESRIRSLIELAADAIFIADPAGRIVDANRRACTLAGLPQEQLLGQAITGIFPREKPSGEAVALERLKKGAETPFGAEMQRADGSTIPVEIAATPMPDGVIQVICRNMTDRLRAEEQALHTQKLESIGRLAGGVAHDFNNLLTVINGYSDLMLRESTAGSRAEGRLAQISKAGKRAAELTQQLLAFSRKQIVQPQSLNLNEEIAGSEKLLRALLTEDIELVLDLDPALYPVFADAGQIHQVLMNLSVNARDAMPHGGKLRIETRNCQFDSTRNSPGDLAPGKYVQLAVADTGVGMDEATRAQVFEPFFTTKPKGSGTGLGLSMVHGIVLQSRGAVTLSSELGRGTTVQVYLPLAPAAPLSPAEMTPAGGAQGAETILVVEDQAEVRNFASGVLRGLGYQVLEAADGAQAIQVAGSAAETIHLLVSDVIMPGITGKDVAERLCGHDPRMKVVFMSGYTDDILVGRGVQREGVSYLSKPFSPDELAAAVRGALDRG